MGPIFMQKLGAKINQNWLRLGRGEGREGRLGCSSLLLAGEEEEGPLSQSKFAQLMRQD